MTSIRNKRSIHLSATELCLIFAAFLFLWSYLIIRSVTVFYVHDEIVTMWSYVVHWNPFPNQGNVDANNHFLLSLLAGAFIRLFNSDSMFVMRLGSVLAFPIYFWSLFRLNFLFQQKWNFFAMLMLFSTSAFLIEFFSLARGYGLASAFLVFSLQQTALYFYLGKKRVLLGACMGWLLAVYSSLTLLPFALLGVLLLLLFTLKRRFFIWLVPILLSAAALAYFVQYSFLLKELGKLYYGGTDGFFVNTVETLTFYLWNCKSVWLNGVLTLLFCFIMFVAIRSFWKVKDVFEPSFIFSLFLFAGVVSILVQHWLFGVNFPEDRTAIYLVIFFFGALTFAIDEFTARKGMAFGLIGIAMAFFLWNFNFSHSIAFYEEHVDVELVKRIPKSVYKIPPTTSGRWNMENELTRELELPFRVYQSNDQPSDTLVDYMIFYPSKRKELLKFYNVLHQDEVSGLALLERKVFLPRTRVDAVTNLIVSKAEFQTLYSSDLIDPLILRCSGNLDQLTKEKEIFIVFSSEDSLSKQRFTYEAVPIVRNKKVTDSGEMHFDFSYALNAIKGANSFAVYIWNQKRGELQGEIKLEVYSIDD